MNSTPFEMVHLVLQAGRRAGRRAPPRAQCRLVEPFGADARRAVDVAADFGDRQAAFVIDATALRDSQTISGLMNTFGSRIISACGASSSASRHRRCHRSRRCRSMTRRRIGTPTWIAARPMPGASYIVSNMSAISVRCASVTVSTGFEITRSRGSGSFDDLENGHGARPREVGAQKSRKLRLVNSHRADSCACASACASVPSSR